MAERKNGTTPLAEAISSVLETKPARARKSKATEAEPEMVSSVKIPGLRMAQLEIEIVGLPGSRLVTHQFSAKAMGEMLRTQRQEKTSTEKRQAKNPVQDFLGGCYAIGGRPQVVGEFKTEMIENMIYGVPRIIRDKAETESGRTVNVNVEASEGNIVPENPEEEEWTPAVYAIGRFGFPAPGFKAAMCTASVDVKRGLQSLIRRNIFIPGEFIEIENDTGAVMRVDMVRLQGIGNPADIRFRPEFTNWRSFVTLQYSQDIFDRDSIINLIGRAGLTVGLGEWRQEKGGQWGGFRLEAVKVLPETTLSFTLPPQE